MFGSIFFPSLFILLSSLSISFLLFSFRFFVFWFRSTEKFQAAFISIAVESEIVCYTHTNTTHLYDICIFKSGNNLNGHYNCFVSPQIWWFAMIIGCWMWFKNLNWIGRNQCNWIEMIERTCIEIKTYMHGGMVVWSYGISYHFKNIIYFASLASRKLEILFKIYYSINEFVVILSSFQSLSLSLPFSNGE